MIHLAAPLSGSEAGRCGWKKVQTHTWPLHLDLQSIPSRRPKLCSLLSSVMKKKENAPPPPELPKSSSVQDNVQKFEKVRLWGSRGRDRGPKSVRKMSIKAVGGLGEILK